MRRPSQASQLVIVVAVMAIIAVAISSSLRPAQPVSTQSPVAYASGQASLQTTSSVAPSAASPTGEATSSLPVTASPATASPAQSSAASTAPTPRPAIPTPTIRPTATPAPTATLPTSGSLLLSQLLAMLPTRPEQRDGYSRDLFVHWIDADGDGCDTRHEVLIDESVTTVTVGANCSLSGGEWISPYDGLTFTDPSRLDIDHMVPLAEAWDSGAYAWSADRRERFANDLGVEWSLIAVSASTNRSKGDRDPAEWLPPASNALCPYLADWLAVKVRWGLSVDSVERGALTTLITNCPTARMPVVLAP